MKISGPFIRLVHKDCLIENVTMVIVRNGYVLMASVSSGRRSVQAFLSSIVYK